MLNTKASALGILFPNSFDTTMPELTTNRSAASVPFAGRYRLVDFVLSSMVNGGIDNISILCRENYLSLMDHLGSGREWDLTRKNGGLNIVPPYSLKENSLFHGRVQALKHVESFLARQKENYIVLADANIAANFDFKAFVNAHHESGADVTFAYTVDTLPSYFPTAVREGQTNYYALVLDGNKVTDIKISPRDTEEINASMGIICCGRQWLIDSIREAYVEGALYFERDVVKKNLDKLDVRGYKFTGYHANIYSMKSYFEESMKLLEEVNLDALFNPSPIYTKVRDDNPTRYIGTPVVKKAMLADGCVIEGKVENSILFRGVKVGKGAVVKNCILMQDTVIEAGAVVEYTITDKDVVVGEGKNFCGTADFPAYIPKGKHA